MSTASPPSPLPASPPPELKVAAHAVSQPAGSLKVHADLLSEDVMTSFETEKKRILIVDDRPSDSQLMKIFLEETNEYTVREENDPKAALATAEKFQPHLILLDVMMPGMTGGELAASFKASHTLKAVPIIFLTALVTKEEVAATGGSVGGFPFLAKPVVLSEAVACIRHHLGG